VYALPSSNVIDRLQQIGGTLLAPCVLAGTVLYVVIVATAIIFWGRVGRDIDRAAQAGDQARVLAFLRSPRNIAVSRSENVPFVVLMALMVLRPGS